MYEWLLKDRANLERNRQRKERDVWAWTVIGLVFFGTLALVWLPLLIAAYRT
ncbi:MAG TPA: hypothetical protein VFR73_13180 [Hyphomicrobiaceae bacterium]|nr:hypothetical protein [Hyphomicrobiaceae bacterium]